MYVAFFFLLYFFDLLLVSYSNLIADCLLVFSECFLLLFFRLVFVLLWWQWWQELWNIYGITNVNIIKILFKAKSFVCHHVKILVYFCVFIIIDWTVSFHLHEVTFCNFEGHSHIAPHQDLLSLTSLETANCWNHKYVWTSAVLQCHLETKLGYKRLNVIYAEEMLMVKCAENAPSAWPPDTARLLPSWWKPM